MFGRKHGESKRVQTCKTACKQNYLNKKHHLVLSSTEKNFVLQNQHPHKCKTARFLCWQLQIQAFKMTSVHRNLIKLEWTAQHEHVYEPFEEQQFSGEVLSILSVWCSLLAAQCRRHETWNSECLCVALYFGLNESIPFILMLNVSC